MIKIIVEEKDKLFAKQQIKAFEKIKAGQWRYQNVEAWRGIVCEILTSKWLEENFIVEKSAKGLDNTGIVDDFDMLINFKKVEIKSATKNYFRYIMPKIYDVRNKPKDIYIGVRYNETTEPNQISILGYIKRDDILNFDIEQNKGAPYYKIPLNILKPINNNTFS
tara:strand:+ start:49 stop:543 length:495 start_codon:yes stop_codon:yes gene_type:complete